MREHVASGTLTETTLLILLSLFKENHGYGIGLEIAEKTQGRVELGAGTLYGALNTLLSKEWIRESSVEDRKKKYIITEAGRQQVERERKRLYELIEIIKNTTEAAL